jgi:uncharacterized damage-inducible protein DinB
VSAGGVSFATADDVRRLNRELDERLRALADEIQPEELHVDPCNGEWTLAENLGHIAEFPRFFAPQVTAQLREDHPRVGRTHEHEERLAAIAQARERDLAELRADLAVSFDSFAGTLTELRDDDLTRVAENGKYGPETLSVFLDRYVIGHKAAHVRQLRETIDAVRALAAAPTGAHLVGSVPLPDAESVFCIANEILGDRLRRVPDGETGDRSKWVGWQGFAFKALPQLEKVDPTPGQYPPTPRFRVRAGETLDGATFGDLGYAENALGSFAVFQRLRDAGVVPTSQRFQVSLPTPLAPVAMFVTDDAQSLVEPIYETQILDELRRIVEGVPHALLAIQWDVCIEMWMWEGWLPTPFTDVKREILVRLGHLGDAVPTDVELGYHLCYGDYQHEHFHEPADTANLTDVANGIAGAVHRSIEWIHLPVPIERDDIDYFTPIRELTIGDQTELYLGLVHARDGVDGARRRIRAARRAGIERFGVATECGMGRRPPDRGGSEAGLRELLATHAAVSRSVA